MSKVWTRSRAGTAAPLLRSPVADRPEVHQITLPLPATWETHERVTVYLIDREPLTLIDTGVRSPESRAVLDAALEELGYGLGDIERVVLTHAHRDHTGLAESIRRASGRLECVAHALDAEAIEDYSGSFDVRQRDSIDLFREYGIPEAVLRDMEGASEQERSSHEAEGEPTRVDRVVRGGERLEFKDGSFLIHHSPGHTPGHLLLEDEEAGLLFCGDQLMAQAIPNVEHFYEGEWPEPSDPLGRRPRFKGLSRLRESLRALRGRRFRRLLTGYGGVARQAERTIRDTLLYYDVRLQRIDRGLKHLSVMGQDVTAFEVWRSLYPANASVATTKSQLRLVMSALDCLEDEGHLIAERRDDGVLTYHHG